MRRLTYGEQAACERCGQDVEWHGRKAGWRDRGNGQECLPFEHKGVIIRPRGKHTLRAGTDARYDGARA